MKTKKIVRKEQRTEGLKNEILDAAVEVFKECGYEKATIKKLLRKLIYRMVHYIIILKTNATFYCACLKH
jgi:hypothetical protein